MEKLAINGGPKIVNIDREHFVWPEINENLKTAVIDQLETTISIYNRSDIIEKLENELMKYFNKKYALLTSSGTAALHSMFTAIDIQPSDEVICPVYTFFASVTPLLHMEAIPIFVDIDEYGNIDPDKIEEKITNKTKAILITHMWGIPCNFEKLIKIKEKYNLLLLEDGSHAHGAINNKIKVGSYGDVSAFSMQGQKTLTGGEGGFLLTDNQEVYYKALLFGHYNKRCKDEISKNHVLSKFSVTGMGLKLRIHPIAARIAYENLLSLSSILEKRNQMASFFKKELSKIPGIKSLDIHEKITPSWYAFPIQYDAHELNGLPIEKYHKAILAEGANLVDRPGSTLPLNLLPLFQEPSVLFTKYKNSFSYKKGDFPKAEKFHNCLFKIPVWHNEKDLDIAQSYIKAFQKVSKNFKSIK